MSVVKLLSVNIKSGCFIGHFGLKSARILCNCIKMCRQKLLAVTPSNYRRLAFAETGSPVEKWTPDNFFQILVGRSFCKVQAAHVTHWSSAWLLSNVIVQKI